MNLSTYSGYPIYEPAEGGYYYAGEQLTKSVKVKHGKGKRKIASLYRDLIEEYGDPVRTAPDRLPTDWTVWMSEDGNMCGATGGYVGDSIMYCLEGRNKVGRRAHGWQPYC